MKRDSEREREGGGGGRAKERGGRLMMERWRQIRGGWGGRERSGWRDRERER